MKKCNSVHRFRGRVIIMFLLIIEKQKS